MHAASVPGLPVSPILSTFLSALLLCGAQRPVAATVPDARSVAPRPAVSTAAVPRPAAEPAAEITPAPAWQNEVVYQIFPTSFADTNGDGIGDLRGILGKVDYLHRLGVNAVWLNPIFTSSHFDGGYDVSDYLAIDPQFGTLEDFTALREALHARGIKLVMDLVLNHSSAEHPWYVQEVKLKRLQHQLTELMRTANADDSEAILNLLADPNSRADQPLSLAEAAAARAIDRFSEVDDQPAAAAGYPARAVQLATLARVLAPCAAPEHRCTGAELPFDDFYIWTNTPNNWTSIFSGPAWHAVDGTDAYSLSLFSVHQIDLNWRNPQVRANFGKIVATWESRGVDGMRLDSLGTLSKNPTFPNAAPANLYSSAVGTKDLTKTFTNLPAVHRFLRELAKVYKPDFRSIGEVAFTHSDGALQYSGNDRGEVKEVFVFDHLSYDNDGPKFHPKPLDVLGFKRELVVQQNLIHGRAWIGNYLENHDQLRIPSRLGDPGAYRVQSSKLFAILLMTLEGTPYIYQGQEIGMTNLPVGMIKNIADVEDIEASNFYDAAVKAGASPAATFEVVSARCRDHMRSAMQWSSAPNAGFSSHLGPVRINPNTATINVDAAIEDPQSIWHFYQQLIEKRRQHPSWVHGKIEDLMPNHPKVFAYARSLAAEKTWVLLNISGAPQTVELPAEALPKGALRDSLSNYPDAPALQTKFVLRPWEARVLVGGN
jgi:oligo-1,6-glucosidase